MTETKRVVFPVIWTHKSFIFYQNSEKFSLKFMKAGCSLHEILNFGPRKIIFDFRADYDFSGPTLKIQGRLSSCLNLQFHTKIQKKVNRCRGWSIVSVHHCCFTIHHYASMHVYGNHKLSTKLYLLRLIRIFTGRADQLCRFYYH